MHLNPEMTVEISKDYQKSAILLQKRINVLTQNKCTQDNKNVFFAKNKYQFELNATFVQYKTIIEAS